MKLEITDSSLHHRTSFSVCEVANSDTAAVHSLLGMVRAVHVG